MIGGLVALCCVGGAIALVASMSGDDSDTSSDSGTDSAGDNGQDGVALGTPVRDGKFEFVVSKVECGKSQVGSSALGAQAQGQFCLATMSIKNIGDQAQTFDSSSQFAYDASDRKHSADGAASLYANQNNEAFINEINPGNQVNAVVVFDVPKDAQLQRLELHDSPFSGGVTVKLA
ncbi:DUF4352 domain-containing protein [Micromonospora sp. CPCC 206061]|uniref:DUF4352 domain-containing protein n=1 Tax=Micromonospora sp. CPCC 206061 TaxID=3122410 RepID=UPI002FF0D096